MWSSHNTLLKKVTQKKSRLSKCLPRYCEISLDITRCLNYLVSIWYRSFLNVVPLTNCRFNYIYEEQFYPCRPHIQYVPRHYSDVMISAMAYQSTGVSIVYSIVCSSVALRHWTLWGEFTGGRLIPAQRASNAVPFDDVIMKYAPGCVVFCFLWSYSRWTDMDALSIFFKFAAQVLRQSCDCPSACEATLKDRSKLDIYQTPKIYKSAKRVHISWCVFMMKPWLGNAFIIIGRLRETPPVTDDFPLESTCNGSLTR